MARTGQCFRICEAWSATIPSATRDWPTKAPSQVIAFVKRELGAGWSGRTM